MMLAKKYNLCPTKTHRLIQDHLDKNDIQAVHSDIENLIMQGENHQALALLNHLCQSIIEKQRHTMQEKSPQAQETNQTLKRQLTRTRSSLKHAVACHQADIATFSKFNTAIRMLQQAAQFSQLPAVLRDITRCIRTGAIGIVLDNAHYASFVPRDIPTYPQEELQNTLKAINQYGEKYLGPSRELSHCKPLAAALPSLVHPELPLGSWLIYPFTEKQNEEYLSGFICVFDKDINRYCTRKATDFLEHFCYILGCTICTLRAKKMLDMQRLTDPLTGIPNRAYLMLYGQQILEFAERKGFPVTLLFIDLDGFKALNDHLGHCKGDIALQQVASCLKNLIRKYDMVVRLGGDEFVILLPGVAMKKTGALVARMAQSIKELPMNKEYAQCCLSASIGAADFQRGQTMEQLMAVADQAMYAHKKNAASNRSDS